MSMYRDYSEDHIAHLIWVRKTAFFGSFPYVCPEPVLAK